MTYILYRTLNDGELPGVTPIGVSTTHNFGTGLVDDGFLQLLPESAKPIEITKDEAEAVVWLWTDRSYRKIKVGNNVDTNSEIDGYGTGNTRIDLTAKLEADAVSLGQKIKTQIAIDVFNKSFELFNNNKSPQEIATWEIQKNEAINYTADNTIDTPILNILAAARGITLSDLVARVNTASSANNIKVAELLGQQQALVDSIKACTTIADLMLIDPDNTTTMT